MKIYKIFLLTPFFIMLQAHSVVVIENKTTPNLSQNVADARVFFESKEWREFAVNLLQCIVTNSDIKIDPKDHPSQLYSILGLDGLSCLNVIENLANQCQLHIPLNRLRDHRPPRNPTFIDQMNLLEYAKIGKEHVIQPLQNAFLLRSIHSSFIKQEEKAIQEIKKHFTSDSYQKYMLKLTDCLKKQTPESRAQIEEKFQEYKRLFNSFSEKHNPELFKQAQSEFRNERTRLCPEISPPILPTNNNTNVTIAPKDKYLKFLLTTLDPNLFKNYDNNLDHILKEHVLDPLEEALNSTFETPDTPF